MKPIKTVQRAWFYFRMGHGMYGGFVMGFAGFVILAYQLALKQIPFFAELHLWGFSLIFGLLYGVPMILTGMIHMRTQNWAEQEASAPQSPYEYRMKPFGKDKLLSTPSSLTNIEIQKATLLLIERLAPDIAKEVDSKRLMRELKQWEGMTETLLSGGEIR